VSDADGPPDYLELPVGRFLDLVAADEPAPGGGSVVAVSVALAAGLSSMAARLSTKQLADAAGLARRADGLRERVAPLARADAVAYGRVLAAQREREGDDHGDRVRAALSEAADVPLAVAEVGAEVAGIAARLAGDGNPNLVGDALCAVLLADAGVRVAVMLVEINLKEINLKEINLKEINPSSRPNEDGRLGRARELVETAASARRSAEGEV
jgi:formiminotetrahydrofolate cyclodeaminase